MGRLERDASKSEKVGYLIKSLISMGYIEKEKGEEVLAFSFLMLKLVEVAGVEPASKIALQQSLRT